MFVISSPSFTLGWYSFILYSNFGQPHFLTCTFIFCQLFSDLPFYRFFSIFSVHFITPRVFLNLNSNLFCRIIFSQVLRSPVICDHVPLHSNLTFNYFSINEGCVCSFLINCIFYYFFFYYFSIFHINYSYIDSYLNL